MSGSRFKLYALVGVTREGLFVYRAGLSCFSRLPSSPNGQMSCVQLVLCQSSGADLDSALREMENKLRQRSVLDWFLRVCGNMDSLRNCELLESI